MTTEKAREFSEAEVARHFGNRSNSGAAHKLSNDKDKSKYARMKRLAILDGLIDAPPEWSTPAIRDRWKPKELSEEQIRLRAETSLEEVQSWYCGSSAGGTKNLGKEATENPENYRRIKSAAIAWNVIHDQPMPQEPAPKPVERETILTVPEDHCRRLGLAVGTKVGQEQIFKILEIITKVDEAKATTDAQKARDAAVDASVSTFGHVREIPGTGAAVIAAGLQSENAAKRTTS